MNSRFAELAGRGRRAAVCGLAVVVGGSAVVGAVTAQPASAVGAVRSLAGAVSGSRGPGRSLGAAKLAASEQSALFIARSGCPVAFTGSRLVGRVTRGNRGIMIDRLVKQTLVANAKDGVCTGIGRPHRVSPAALASYRSIVARRVSPGDIVLREAWRLPSGRNVAELAVFRNSGRLRFDPLLSTYALPAPPLVVTTSVASAAAGRDSSRSYEEFKWDPVVNGGLVENIWGSDVVTKTVRMRLYVTDGLITDSTEVATASGSTFVNVTISKRVETVSRGGCDCKKFTVTVKWASVLSRDTGTDIEVFTLCSNGLKDYVQSN